MRAMRLFGIRIDDVRDIFGAPPEVAAALSTVFADHYPTPAMKRRWGLFRRNPDPEVDPSHPLKQDAEILLTGGLYPRSALSSAGRCSWCGWNTWQAPQHRSTTAA